MERCLRRKRFMIVPILLAAGIGLAPGGQNPDSLPASLRLQPAVSSLTAVRLEPALPGALQAPALPARINAVPPLGAPGAEPQLVDYSDAYYTRLKIHKWASYLTLPLFLGEWYTGNKLLKESPPPSWVRPTHRAFAGGVGALFVVNTITGGMNLWEGRHDPDGRTRRFIHAGLMMLADAGFVATGITGYHLRGQYAFLGHDRRALHQHVAMASMITALVSYAMMLPPFRKD